MSKIELLMCAECLHDGVHIYEDTPESVPIMMHVIRVATCSLCGKILYKSKMIAKTGTITNIAYHDEIYEMLYTPKGRQGLLEDYLRNYPTNVLVEGNLLVAILEGNSVSVPSSWIFTRKL